jgi:N-acetyltransferase
MTYLTLTGRYVALLPLQPDHAAGLWEAGSAPEIWSFMRSGVTSLPEMEQWVSAALNERDKTGSMPYAIQEVSTGMLVGSTRVFDIQPAHRNGEIGHTWYAPRVWRTALNTECKLLLMGYCFEQLNFLRLQFKTCSRNVRSQKAIERLGAVKEGMLRDNIINADGYVRTSVYYSVLQREWPEVKARLEGMLENAKYKAQSTK